VPTQIIEISVANGFGEIGGAAQLAGLDAGFSNSPRPGSTIVTCLVDQVDLGGGDVTPTTS
jgi:hypothetical protein